MPFGSIEGIGNIQLLTAIVASLGGFDSCRSYFPVLPNCLYFCPGSVPVDYLEKITKTRLWAGIEALTGKHNAKASTPEQNIKFSHRSQ
jgi:hypothetical protein